AGAVAARPEPTRLQRRLQQGAFVVSVQIEPPAGTRLEPLLALADELAGLGVDCRPRPEPAGLRGRISGLALAARLAGRGELDVVLHCTTRDRNLLGLQADALGAQALGVRNLLAVTGDPLQVPTYPYAAGVW